MSEILMKREIESVDIDFQDWNMNYHDVKFSTRDSKLIAYVDSHEIINNVEIDMIDQDSDVQYVFDELRFSLQITARFDLFDNNTTHYGEYSEVEGTYSIDDVLDISYSSRQSIPHAIESQLARMIMKRIFDKDYQFNFVNSSVVATINFT